MKGKIIWIGIGLIALSLLGNFFYFQMKQIEEPIFIEHYISREFGEEQEILIPLYYLTNKHYPVTVSYVEFDEFYAYPMDEGTAFFFNNQPQIQYEQEFSHQYLMKTTLNIPSGMIYEQLNDRNTLSFTNMRVHFSNGQVMDADIGEVRLSKRDIIQESPLEFRSSTGSSNYVESDTFVTKEDLIIEEITVPFSQLENDLVMKVDLPQEQLKELKTSQEQELPDWYSVQEDMKGVRFSADLLPIQLESNHWIKLYQQHNPNQLVYIESPIHLVGTTKTGQDFQTNAHINYRPYLEQKDIQRIIDEKGGR